MRHAHRLPFQAGSLGNDVAITSEGKQLANRLGRQLASFPIHCIETSSVLRCMQTAQSIIDCLVLSNSSR
ncbi:MAG: histidine phosphatase family protein [Ignavibacteriae bacterium]|nr:histidine phosphatase family protein [Ignavibacteriota bacterium]